MSGVFWQLADSVAKLRLGRLHGELKLTRPDLGVGQLTVDGIPRDADHVLGVEFLRPDVAPSVPQSFCRGGSLDATYAPSPTWPVCVESRWQATDGSTANVLAAIDAVVSVRTELLDSQPALVVSSRLHASEVLHRSSEANATWKPLRDLPATVEPARSAGCFVFRLVGQPWSYVEMVCPADFQRSEFRAEHGGPIVVRHRLFTPRLEKGVILRARVRGTFLSREGDLAQAEELYRKFAAADPPLSA